VHQVALDEPLIVGVDACRVAGEGADVEVQIGAAVLVEHGEQGDELAVHVLGGAVPSCLALGGDDDRPHQPGVGVAALIHMGVGIHSTELGSFGPGPERGGTCHTCRTRPPGGTASSALAAPLVPSL
jgi:hypothetical protein